MTRRTAVDAIRRDARRQRRENQVADEDQMMNPQAEWMQIEPWLDEALDKLDAPARTVILLRFFEGKSLREVGSALRTSEDAAQKRVERAVEQLRKVLVERGSILSSQGIAITLSTALLRNAPTTLHGSILKAVSVAAPATLVGTKTFAITAQKALVTALLVTVGGIALYQAHRVSRLNQAIATRAVEVERQPLSTYDARKAELEEVETELVKAKNEQKDLREQMGELARLRNKLANMRTAASALKDPALVLVESWVKRINQLKDQLRAHPEKSTPEIQLLKEADWFDIARTSLETHENDGKTLSRLREAGKDAFVLQDLYPASDAYKAEHPKEIPDMATLAKYFEVPVDNSILQRWEVVPSDPDEASVFETYLLKEIGPVDEQYDKRLTVAGRFFGFYTKGTNTSERMEPRSGASRK